MKLSTAMYVSIFGESSGRCNFWQELKSLDRKTSIDRHLKTMGPLLDLLARFCTDINVGAIEARHLNKANMNGNIVPLGRYEGLSRLIVTLSIRSLNRTSIRASSTKHCGDVRVHSQHQGLAACKICPHSRSRLRLRSGRTIELLGMPCPSSYIPSREIAHQLKLTKPLSCLSSDISRACMQQR